MNLTFLIPVKLESEDRVRNLKTVLTYLLTKFDAKILVQEYDTVNNFSTTIQPYLTKRFGIISHRFEYIFDKQKTSYFHKTKVLNDLLQRSDTEIVCNYDTDVLLPETSYITAYNMIKDNQSDVVYPYGCGAYQKAVTFSNKTLENNALNPEDLFKMDCSHDSNRRANV